MQLRVFPESFLEWLALRLNLVPLPLLHAQVLPVVSKAVLEATDRGIFEAIDQGHTSAQAIADACQLHVQATTQLLGVLTSVKYLSFKNGHYSLTRMTRKWVLPDSKHTVGDLAVFNNRVVWSWLEKLGTYLESGKGLQYHETLTSEEWKLYQKAMYGGAISEAEEFARKVPLPKNATQMLDIGGAHGLHSVALCRKYPTLHSVILDLPGAVEQAAPLLAAQNMGEQVQHQVGDVLTTELGESTYDLVLMSSVAHHLTEAQNREVTRKVAHALRPGGIFIINEFIRPDPAAKPELVGSSTDLFFGLTSTSGNWSIAEIHEWYQAAGLKSHQVLGYQAIPGRYQVIAKK